MTDALPGHIEHTFVMVKPEGIMRNLTGAIIGRFESRDLRLVAMKMVNVSRSLAAAHYHRHSNMSYFNDLVQLMVSGPVVAMVWEGEHAIRLCRQMTGSANPLEALPGTIRGDFAGTALNSLIHVSDSPITADAEMALWFPEGMPGLANA